MKLQDAIRQMKPGDIFKTGKEISDIICTEGDDPPDAFLFKWKGPLKGATEHIRLTSVIMDYEGQIIKAEPEVLEPHESWAENYGDVMNFELKRTFIVGFKSGDKNGQNKEWKRMKPLIDTAQAHVDMGYSTKLEKILKNLQPPWESN